MVTKAGRRAFKRCIGRGESSAGSDSRQEEPFRSEQAVISAQAKQGKNEDRGA